MTKIRFLTASYIMEHNYFYPFGLYSLYAIRIFRWLEDRMREMGRYTRRTIPLRLCVDVLEPCMRETCGGHKSYASS